MKDKRHYFLRVKKKHIRLKGYRNFLLDLRDRYKGETLLNKEELDFIDLDIVLCNCTPVGKYPINDYHDEWPEPLGGGYSGGHGGSGWL